MWPFKHKHREWSRRTILKPSLVTGVPIGAGTIIECRCGKELGREVSAGSALQQLSWGADYNSLFDDGPIKPAKGMEEVVEQMREAFWGGLKS